MRSAILVLIGGALAVSGCVTTSDPTTLGTLSNPVLTRGPSGERAYLDRLRCADGSAPTYHRQGSGGGGRDGHIVDFYEVTCTGQEPVIVVMDMYHSNGENRPVPGFTIVGG
ncbi:hypothetical protein [Aurantiacibacter sp. D1-12]|uniref:hypothetical protein n=1 Tax=Aurantiacibacter sp. D1-12 TaxID=2993658 RepID=UPI00237D154C|nr:hypothetical protein [Aurantiacibacter sp. D1-12]MDE1467338.1 hypothetical protein [Aurantiacibacter sp. D1-12]